MTPVSQPLSNIPWYTLTEQERSARIHGRFVSEGSFVAFPLCLPGASLPIIHDESAITALATTGDGLIYGGTSGFRCHLFAAIFHGAGGGVLDLGVVTDADQCVALAVGAGFIVACVNGPSGGRLILRAKQEMASDLIQEWDFGIEPTRDLGQPASGEPILHAVADASGQWLIGLTSQHLFRYAIGSDSIELLAPLKSVGAIAADLRGNVYGLEVVSDDQPASLWRCHAATGLFTRNAIPLPAGAWSACRPVWTRHPLSGELFLSDAAGRIYSFADDHVGSALAKVPYAPLLTMAATADGRIFGHCGEGICRLFVLDLSSGELKDLACVASVLQAKRYGYQFASAVLGRDGQIIFGENDNGAHLWLYFPRIKDHVVLA
jgi:hypothetical protein